MLTKDEKRFISFWEENREKAGKPVTQLARGLPLGLIFALPVLIAVIFHDWYKNMVYISNAEMIVIIIGVLAVAIFFAIFRMRFKWENNEQLYKELKFKEKNDDAAHC
jgi:pilus assembly protein TadC